MISFIVMYTTAKDFSYTVKSIIENAKEEIEIISVMPQGAELLEFEKKIKKVEYGLDETLIFGLNRALDKAENNICFLVKSGCLLIEEAITSLNRNILDNEVGIALPKINTFFESQKHIFANIFKDQIIKEAKQINSENYGLKTYTKDIDDNLIVIKKDNVKVVGLFDENIKSLPVAYKDYLIRNFQNNLSVVVCQDALVYSKKICSKDELESEAAEVLNEKLGFKFSYYSGVRSELVDFISENPYEDLKVLEVGCGSGNTLMDIKNKFPYCDVYGIEIEENCKKIVPPCVHVKIGDCMKIIDEFEEEIFDYIFCPDVLEHLVDPYKFLRQLKSKLSNTGKLIVSIPNVAHISVIAEILNGQFNYKDAGILDRTHLRFFTISTMIHMLNEAGYAVSQISGVRSGGYGEDVFINELINLKLVNKSLQHPVDLATQFSVIQFHLICNKAGEL